MEKEEEEQEYEAEADGPGSPKRGGSMLGASRSSFCFSSAVCEGLLLSGRLAPH